MKKFLLRLALFIGLGLAVFHAKSYWLWRDGKYEQKVAASDVYRSIHRSKQKTGKRKVLIGDSVARQFFSNETENDTIESLASNQAVSLAGQYILLDNYLKAGNVIDTCYAVFVPSSFQNNLAQSLTYNYFVKPFYRDEYQPMLTDHVRHQLAAIPFVPVAHWMGVVTNNWSPEFETVEDHSFEFFSPLSVQYIHKLEQLAAQHRFKLLFVAPPCSESQRHFIAGFDRKELANNGLDGFNAYFDLIEYVPSPNFFDNVHFREPEKYRAMLTKKMH